LRLCRGVGLDVGLVPEPGDDEKARYGQYGDGRQQARLGGPSPRPFVYSFAPANGPGQDWLAPLKPAQVVLQLRRAAVALRWVFLKAFQADRFQVDGGLGAKPARRRVLVVSTLGV